MTSASFFHVLKENARRGGVLARFHRPGGGGFELFFVRGSGIRPSKKLPGGFARVGWSGLELTDTHNR